MAVISDAVVFDDDDDDDEALAGLPGHEERISPPTKRVAELLRDPAVRNRIRMQCRESQEHTQQRRDQHADWNRRRYEYLSSVPWEWKFIERITSIGNRTKKVRQKVGKAPKVPSQSAPKKGWVLIEGPVWSPNSTKDSPVYEKVRAWVPPELCDTKKPYDGPLLPFPSQSTYKLSLADSYYVVAAVHDAERQGLGKIKPFAAEEVKAFWSYKFQKEKVSCLRAFGNNEDF